MKLRGERVLVNGSPVDDVLVHIGDFERSNIEADDIKEPLGVKADYTLYFPMTFNGDLTGKEITVRNITCKVLGHPDHERPEQVFDRNWLGRWDMTVRVEKVMDSKTEAISVWRWSFTRDELGDMVPSTMGIIWTGRGQARKASGQTDEKHEGTIAEEVWYFVIPWNNQYKSIPVQQLTVSYNNRTYRVEDIQDVDWKHEYASIKAVYHG